MGKMICLMSALILHAFFPKCAQAESGDDPNIEVEKIVSIQIIKLNVNDTTLELSYKIKNNTDHNVWICDYVSVYTQTELEVYLSENTQSLVIRRRLNVPTAWTWGQCPYGRYVLLRPDQERIESLSLAVPVQPRFLFAGGRSISDHAKRLVLEIGFYNEDLPGMILDILEIAEKLNCVHIEYEEYRTEIFKRYFNGIWISHILFGGFSGFEEYTYQEGNEEIKIPYTWQRFSGEQVLRTEVNGVHIPCEEVPWALDGPSQNETEPTGVTMALTGLDVNDTKLELGWKIMNKSDHDVWICDNVDVFGPSHDFEVYMSEDEQSLLIRRRLEVPSILYWAQLPYGRYILLHSGQERMESISLDVPVHPERLFASGQATSDHVKRLVLKIGFYNEDLPGMIRNVLEMVEKLNCALLDYSEYKTDFFKRYFKGIWINQIFGGLSGFENFHYKEGSDEINIPYTWQNFNGEQILRIQVDSVHIPYQETEN